ncbi:MAG: amino acid ABC transporter substrate-binding protein, partial [Candidatus Limosilactobacillus intestinavium]
PEKYAVANNIRLKYNKKTAGKRVAVRKDDKALLKKVNATISKDKKNGTLKKLYQQAQDIQVQNNK